MFIGAIKAQKLDTKTFLELPESKFLVAMMVAVNDFQLHDTTVSRIQTQLTQHRYHNDLSPAQMQLLEAELNLLQRHQFGLIWESLELLNELSTNAPSILAFMNSFPELKNIYELVLPFCKSDKLRRIRNNLSFHFGVKFMEQALTTVQDHPTVVLKTAIGDNFWYEVADEVQAHLLTRNIAKIVNDQSTAKEATQKAEKQGLEMKALKQNVISIFLSVIEHFLEPLYLL